MVGRWWRCSECCREGGRGCQSDGLHRGVLDPGLAIEAGEPVIDAEFVALVMAMDIEKLLEHPRFGVPTQEAHARAEAKFSAVQKELEAKERTYRARRAALAQADGRSAG